MAEKLSITIALEGGKQIEQQLDGIGKAGQTAFEDISKAAEKAGGFKNLKPEDVTAKLQQMGVTGKEALDKISGAVTEATRLERIVGIVQGVEKGFAGLSAAAGVFVKSLGPIGLVAGTVGAALINTMSKAAEAINDVDKAAIKAGISIGKFDQLRQGFEAAGLSAKEVASGMSAIGKAAEQAKLDQVTKDFQSLQNLTAKGFGVLGTAEWERLNKALEGAGPATEAARKAITDLGGTLTESATKTLPEFIAKFGGDAVRAVAAFVEQLRTMPDSASRSQQAIAGLDAAGVALVQAFRTGQISADQFRERLGALTQEQANAASTWEQNANRMSTAWTRFTTAVGGELLVTNTMREFETILTGITTLLNASADQWKAAIAQIFEPITGFVERLTQAIGASIDQVSGWINSLLQMIAKVGGAIKGAFGGGGGGGPAAGSIPGNAAGGLIGGRGTGTSDSNLAWVSRGEHIMPARAVAQPGVLALLEALRRTGGNLRGVMNGMGRFAAGGLIPRFAEGGLVGGGMGHLGTVDLRTDHGVVRLMAGASAVEQLTRLAVTKRMTSTGRKPGFVGG
jgi:hypothetical protein